MIVTRTHEFCAAHRIVGHHGKCKNLHGHNYRVTFHIKGEIQDNGMVVDFAEIKKRCCNYIDSHWDHKTILWEEDPIVIPLKKLTDRYETIGSIAIVSFNTTAENMALFLLRRFKRFGVTQIDVRETEKCSVTALASQDDEA